jgi:hypothetical protein
MFRRRLPTPRCMHRVPSDGSWVLQGLWWHFPKKWVSLVYSTLNPAGFVFFCKLKIHAKSPNLLGQTDINCWLLIDDMNSLRMCSYPPPREKCAGPSCTNPYKYRDSKSKLPLCSLQCYKAIQQQSQHETNWWRLKIYLHSHVNISYNYWGQASKEAFFIQYRGIIQIWMVHFLSSIA